jgi:hypothetical protein
VAALLIVHACIIEFSMPVNIKTKKRNEKEILLKMEKKRCYIATSSYQTK